MTKVKLRMMYRRGSGAAEGMNLVIARLNPEIAVWDPDGKLLLGNPELESLFSNPDVEKLPIEHQGQLLGWVRNLNRAELISSIIIQNAERESELRSLADATLELQREINLINNYPDKLTGSLAHQIDLKSTHTAAALAATALGESRTIIDASDGAIILKRKPNGKFSVAATFGGESDWHQEINGLQQIIYGMMESGRSTVVNDLGSDTRYRPGPYPISSLIGAPLNVQNEAIGLILLANRKRVRYTAAARSLLATLASQTAPVMEYALLYEQDLRMANEQREQLETQLNELRKKLETYSWQEYIDPEDLESVREKGDELRRLIWGDE